MLWNTKYSPSDVQLPQHSCGGLFQLGNSSGCGFLPSARASHSEDTPGTKADVTVKRMRDPSGESLIPLGGPGAVSSLRALLLSCSARNTSAPLANTNLPSGS